MSMVETRYNVPLTRFGAGSWASPRAVVFRDKSVEPLDKTHGSFFEAPVIATLDADQASPLDDVAVPARSVMRASSGIVGLVSGASLALSMISNFNMIHPLISTVTVIASAAFFLMSFAPFRTSGSSEA
jgi:hypothetical protein